jgi:hypothetical protein
MSEIVLAHYTHFQNNQQLAKMTVAWQWQIMLFLAICTPAEDIPKPAHTAY